MPLSKKMAFEMADVIKEWSDEVGIPLQNCVELIGRLLDKSLSSKSARSSLDSIYRATKYKADNHLTSDRKHATLTENSSIKPA